LINRQRVEKSASSGGQRPNRVQVVRRHDNRHDVERVVLARCRERAPQIIDVVDQQAFSVGDGEMAG
jgi:hypothetical protein